MSRNQSIDAIRELAILSVILLELEWGVTHSTKKTLKQNM